MSNEENILQSVRKSSQPVVIVSQDEDDWMTLSEKVLSDLNINTADIIFFNPDEGVKLLRERISQLNLKPHSSEFRFLIIFYAEKLNSEQSNTLLKTLEEPPNYVRIAIFTKVFTRILPTIRSRCQKLIISKQKESGGESLLGYFETSNFNEFLQKLNQLDNETIPAVINLTLEEIKDKMLNKDTLILFKKLSRDLEKSMSTNVNKKLLLESTFIWWKAERERW